MGDTANLCAALHAWFTFAIIDPPETFKRFAVREAFLKLDRSTYMVDGETKNIAYLGM